MTSGLAWNEWGAPHGTSANDIDMLYFNCNDPITCVLERPWVIEPLGIDSTLWTQYGNGMYDAAESLRSTPRDMLKLGVTYLNDGVWNGERIISSDWVENSSRTYKQNKRIKIPIEDSGKNGYAYSWWTSELSHSGDKIMMFRAGGWGGQSIMVFSELDMVIVFTGGNYATNSSLTNFLNDLFYLQLNNIRCTTILSQISGQQ